MSESSEETIGGMEIVARLSTGGMAKVLLARRRGAHGFERLVAIKTIRPDLQDYDEIKRMFRDEARLLSHLDHPAIAQVYDFGEEDGVLFLSMEYVPGIPLSRLFREKAPIPSSVVARIAVEACHGLHAAHELKDLEGQPLGVVHRDISPQNLMLTFDGRIKILDFGVAFMREREAATTVAGLVKGKLSYVSPEQMTHQSIDRRSDLYSLSIVLHELLTGKRLFKTPKAQLAEALRRPAPARPSAIEKQIPQKLDEVVMRGLKADPKDRYQSAKEMAEALEQAITTIGGETTTAFVDRVLTSERKTHEEWLRQIKSQNADPTKTKVQLEATTNERKTAPTVPSVEPIELESVVDEGTQQQEQDLFYPTPPPPKESRFFVMFLILLLVGAAAVLFFRSDLIWTGEQLGFTEDDSAIALDEDAGSRTTTVATTVTTTIAEIKTTTTTTKTETKPKLEEPKKKAPAKPVDRPTPKKKVTIKKPPKRLKRASKKRKSKTRYGWLTIRARKGGSIFVGGKRIGGTPLRRKRLAAGRHLVALRRPGDKKPRWTAWVVILPGKHAKVELK